jgi:hypothetical protein
MEFTFDLPGCLTFAVEAGDEQDAKELIHTTFAHLNTAGIALTPKVRLVSIEVGKDQSEGMEHSQP